MHGVRRTIDLPGIAVDVPAGKSLFLTVSPVADMFAGQNGRVPNLLRLDDLTLQYKGSVSADLVQVGLEDVRNGSSVTTAWPASRTPPGRLDHVGRVAVLHLVLGELVLVVDVDVPSRFSPRPGRDRSS